MKLNRQITDGRYFKSNSLTVLLWNLDGNLLHFSVVVQSVFSKFSAKARLKTLHISLINYTLKLTNFTENCTLYLYCRILFYYTSGKCRTCLNPPKGVCGLNES